MALTPHEALRWYGEMATQGTIWTAFGRMTITLDEFNRYVEKVERDVINHEYFQRLANYEFDGYTIAYLVWAHFFTPGRIFDLARNANNRLVPFNVKNPFIGHPVVLGANGQIIKNPFPVPTHHPVTANSATVDTEPNL